MQTEKPETIYDIVDKIRVFYKSQVHSTIPGLPLSQSPDLPRFASNLWPDLFGLVTLMDISPAQPYLIFETYLKKIGMPWYDLSQISMQTLYFAMDKGVIPHGNMARSNGHKIPIDMNKHNEAEAELDKEFPDYSDGLILALHNTFSKSVRQNL